MVNFVGNDKKTNETEKRKKGIEKYFLVNPKHKKIIAKTEKMFVKVNVVCAHKY